MNTQSFISDFFLCNIWENFSATLVNDKTRKQYFSLISDICTFCQKDFLALSLGDVDSYFSYLMEKYKTGGHTANTLLVKRAQLHSVSNYIIKHASILGVREYTSNPFINLTIPETNIFIESKDIPSLLQINEILEAAVIEPRLFVAISLVIRCALSATELLNIKMNHFFSDSAGRFGLKINTSESDRIVKVPEDIMKIIVQHGMYFEPEDYLLQNHKGEKMSYRYLNRLYHKYVPVELPYNLSDIRHAAIAYMLAGGSTPSDVAAYTGISPVWMFRYDKVVSELSIAPCDYSHLQIVRG